MPDWKKYKKDFTYNRMPENTRLGPNAAPTSDHIKCQAHGNPCRLIPAPMRRLPA